MTTLRALSVAFLFTCVACGGGAPHAEHAEHHEGGGEEHHGALPPPVNDFHEVLAPLWHAEKGPDRVAKTCAAAMDLDKKASAIGAAPTPEGADDAAWKGATASLSAATRALVAECEKEGRPELEARFTAVHEGFHGLAERLHH